MNTADDDFRESPRGREPMLSVVIPMFRTSAFLHELWEQLNLHLPADTEIVFVDDACPEGSGDSVADLSAGLRRLVVKISPNGGQHAAVLTGLRYATGSFVAVMDADLQDSPRALALLLAAHRSQEVDAVCAQRRGQYADLGRRLTAKCYRRAATLLSRGRIPIDASMFVVMRSDAALRVLELDDPYVPLVPALARCRARMIALPVERERRPTGTSGYSGTMRANVAARGLLTMTPTFRLLRRSNHARQRRRPRTVLVERSFATTSKGQS
jgi:polyisoprenyl-phosphate glycosyltransferase